jgi:nucleotide-binding universal stress UspA family protein
MFKHLLVPIDGSDVTKKALKKVLDLAKKDAAIITLAYVSDPMPPMVYSDSSLGYGFTQLDHKKACDAFAKNLFKAASAVLGDGLTVRSQHIYSSSLAGGVLDAAKKAKADVIVMASHKRTGIKGILLGSQTNEVIVHSSLPVIVLG